MIFLDNILLIVAGGGLRDGFVKINSSLEYIIYNHLYILSEELLHKTIS